MDTVSASVCESPPIHQFLSTRADLVVAAAEVASISPVTFIMMKTACCCWNANELNHAGKTETRNNYVPVLSLKVIKQYILSVTETQPVASAAVYHCWHT